MSKSKMKILVLTKRQYMAKDLLDDRFGRFRELPLELALLGHDVQGLALSYRRRPEGSWRDERDSSNSSVTWNSINLVNGYLPQIERYARRALKISRQFRPDIIWVCSDAYHAIFGSWLAKRVGPQCVIDLYDNFEAFGASRVPGILPLFRRAVKAADGVSTFSRKLADHVTRGYMRSKPTTIIENGVRPDLFYPRDRADCRRRLGLPLNVRIIGTAGALETSRGIEALFKSFERLSAESSDVHLALAGPRPRGIRIPNGPRVHDLKELAHEDVPLFVNSLDVAVICYRHSAQGEYSFPQKAYEIIACRVPLVAAAVGSMNDLLRNYPECLYEPDDSANLANAIRRQLDERILIEIPVPSWADSAKELSDFFMQIVEGRSSPPGTELKQSKLG
jgi:teichuronic acid biosynthesis glycosyltransferase TuaC